MIDVDMQDRDDGSGAKEVRVDDVGRELSNGSGSASQTPGHGAAPSSTVPMNTLRFGSFEPASAPPRLWSDRVGCDDVLEHTLPTLDFDAAEGSIDGCLDVIVTEMTVVEGGGRILGRWPLVLPL